MIVPTPQIRLTPLTKPSPTDPDQLVWDGIRRPSSVSPVLALSGLLPRGRGSLQPIHRMLDTVVAGTIGAGTWPQRTWIVATDYTTGRRRAFLRFFACEEDLSHELPDALLPEPVVRGAEPFLIVGALAGG